MELSASVDQVMAEDQTKQIARVSLRRMYFLKRLFLVKQYSYQNPDHLKLKW